MKYIVTLNDKQYEVEVEKGKAVAAYIGEAPGSGSGLLPLRLRPLLRHRLRLLLRLLRPLRQAQAIR